MELYTGAIVVSSPAIVNGLVYIGSYDHIVDAIGSLQDTKTYSVEFIQSGLPSGALWSVIFNYEAKSTISDSTVFNASNGVYTYSVAAPRSYEASPSSGLIILNFADIKQPINLHILNSGRLHDNLYLPILITIVVTTLLVIAHRRRKIA